MTITPIFFLAIFPAILLLAGVIVMLLVKQNDGRENLHLIISSINLIITIMVIIISTVFPNQEIFFNIILSPYHYTLFGIIFLFQFIFSIFIKYTSKNYPNSYLFDIFSFFLFFSLLGMVISINYLTLMSFYILALFLMGMIYFFGEFKKEFALMKNYFIASLVSVISLILVSFIIYIDTGNLRINNLVNMDLSDISSNLILFLIILGFGLPCGLFPFYITHLRKYFQECDYYHLVMMVAFNFISMLIIMRLFNLIGFGLISLFIIMITSGLGVAIAVYYNILELFTVQDGFTYSVKKVIGYNIIYDSNLILFFLANFNFFPEPFRDNLLNLLIFFYISSIFIKLFLIFSFLQTANKSSEDNFRLLGNFWKNNKNFGILLFISGLALIFPLTFIFIYSLISNLELAFPLLNSFVSLISIIAICLLIISILITLLYISRLFIQIYISKNFSYLEKESSSQINKFLIYLISLLFILVIIICSTIYIYNPNWYLGLISLS